MIDRPARNRLAEIGRQLMSGRLKTQEYELCRPDSDDRAVYEIEKFFWSQYDDISPPYSHRLVGKRRPSDELRKIAARAALFLYSNMEYGWPSDNGATCTPLEQCREVALLILAAMTLFGTPIAFVFIVPPSLWSGPLVLVGIAAACIAAFATSGCVYLLSRALDKRACERAYHRWVDTQRQLGDFDVWPFIRKRDFEQAKRLPILFRAKAARHLPGT
jgi:hypothetical protein